jgi:hypothetical protein
MKNNWLSAGDFCAAKIARLLVSTLCLVGLAYLLPSAAQATTYYVSKTATAGGDGLSWGTAFNELNKIPQPLYGGDVVEIDGGASSMRYDTPLVVRSKKDYLYSTGSTVTIKTSSAPGRNGQVLIVGTGTGTGIDIVQPGTAPDVNVVGRTWRSFRVFHYAVGARVTGFSNLSNVQLDNNSECGLIASGYSHTFNQLVINDNGLNVRQFPDWIDTSGISLTRCWIFNSDANAYRSDGILMQNTSGLPLRFYTLLRGCVMGPGLKNGFVDEGRINSVYQDLSLSNCLLINPGDANFATNKVRIDLTNVTSFLTPLNSSGRAHSCLSAYSDDAVVKNSIFFGGVVTSMRKGSAFTQAEQTAAQQVGFRRFGPGNVQFRTSGNTLVLSPTQTNPQFFSNLPAIGNNVLPGQLHGLDFRHQVAPNSGSLLISIGQLLSKNYP